MMEISWKWFSLCLGLLFFQLCNGFPINLGDTAADQHTQLLTGLVAVLLTVCSVVLLAGCLCCPRSKGFKEFRDSPVIASSQSNLDHGHVNPIANGEFTIFTPLSPPHYNNNVFIANEQIITRTSEDYRYGDIDVSCWFNELEKDFPRTKLKYIKELGKGWFGKVVEGAAQDIDPKQTWAPAVVRILDAAASSKERVLFLHDASIYKCSPHPNVLGLVGKCLDTVPLLLLQEHCTKGDLKAYLRNNNVNPENLLSTEYPLIWCCQLTSALKHLHTNKIVHPDIAARNCLLTTNLTLKLGDYGLSVSKYPHDYYQGPTSVPVRWCSPESLNCTSTTIEPRKITTEANIWSLGVTIWEIFECGAQPYANLTDDEVVTQVFGSHNLRLSRPSYPVLYTDYIYRLMQLCWTNAESRPAVVQIDLMLSDLLQVHNHTKAASSTESSLSIDDFDRRWESFKPNAIVKTDHIDDSLNDDSLHITKPLSPSLNNLHGSLDNLVDDTLPPPESWLENVASTNSDSYVRSLSNAIRDLDNVLALENSSSLELSARPEHLPSISFKLGPNQLFSDPNDSLTSSIILQRTTSSESETEDENWKKKVERGAYTEKVRQKSRSVTDLMVLTAVDYSESESETPLHSLEYKKGSRFAPRNFETVGFFSSEGNLLNIEDNFQEELKKLQVERRDSLSFVPDNNSQNTVVNVDSNIVHLEQNLAEDSPTKRLMQELNSPAAIKPANQIYNVFNVTIGKFSPIHSVKLDKLLSPVDDVPNVLDFASTSEKGVNEINYNVYNNKYDISNKQAYPDKAEIEEIAQDIDDNCEEEEEFNGIKNDPESISHGSPQLQIDENCSYEQEENETNKFQKIDDTTFNRSPIRSEDVKANSNCTYEIQVLEDCKPERDPEMDLENNLSAATVTIDNDKSDETIQQMPNLQNECQISYRQEKIKTYNLCNHQDNSVDIRNNSETESEQNITENVKQIPVLHKIIDTPDDIKIEVKLNEVLGKLTVETECDDKIRTVLEIPPSETNKTDDEKLKSLNHKNADNTFKSVPKLVDIIQNNDTLMDYIINNYDNDSILEDKIEQDTSKEFVPAIDSQTAGCLDNSITPQLHDQIRKNSDIITSEKLQTTIEFKLNDVAACSEDAANIHSTVTFDLSDNQDEAMPNSLTHSTVFASTPFGKKQEVTMPSEDNYCSLHLFGTSSPLEEQLQFSSNFTPLDKSNDNQELNYSLETWDNFLVKSFNNQLQDNDNLFDSFSTEPQSLLFIDSNDKCEKEKEAVNEDTFTVNIEEDIKTDGTFVIEEKEEEADATFVIEGKDETFIIEENQNGEKTEEASWEAGGGWYLHPQSTNENLTGEINTKNRVSGSYVGFSMDDEIMAAIRNELLQKLPHAQGASSDKVKEEDEWDTSEHNEVFLRYNVYNPPLSPILEESYIEENSTGENTPKHQCEDVCSDWSEQMEAENANQATNSQTNESKEQNHRHTLSQDSCCSNDTLFNLEELTCIEKEGEGNKVIKDAINIGENHTAEKNESMNHNGAISKQTEVTHSLLNPNSEISSEETVQEERSEAQEEALDIDSFLVSERNHTTMTIVKISREPELDRDAEIEPTTSAENLLPYVCNKQVAPLPSPEDKPWKTLPVSMLSYDTVTGNTLMVEPGNITQESMEPSYENIPNDSTEEPKYENITSAPSEEPSYESCTPKPVYENIEHPKDIYNEADYVNIVNLENTKNLNLKEETTVNDYVNCDQHGTFIINEETSEDSDDIFGILADIRFNGPIDSQLMTTSFSESADNDEQDWDSGSDTRSSSSGEFIWKEGEHEESLKALRAAPQDVLEDIKPLEGIAEETSESDVSSDSSDEECETPEFVPSAWDKYATPTKSALRSPEKTLERSEKKKPKGVWFKKQKYHCVYEYPREPESPVLQSQDLWKPQPDYSSFADWEFDAETYLPPPTDDSDGVFQSTTTYKPKRIMNRNHLYQLTSISDFTSNGAGVDDEFFISSSARAFDLGNLTSQFFPGSQNWMENATPDSGMEDATPGSLADGAEYLPIKKSVQPLKKLASDAVNKAKQKDVRCGDGLGGLRHTRNKLKLDLPPSPSAFTSSKGFTIEPMQEPVVIREKPTFSTFGKSRFLVQHVDTPPDTDKCKNVSFEAIPYKPMLPIDINRIEEENDKNDDVSYLDDKNMLKSKVEFVRGEASLLDSADEDSGIESSTLERKLNNIE